MTTNSLSNTASPAGKNTVSDVPQITMAGSPAFHPNILLVRWEIAVRGRDWASAVGIAAALIEALPAEPIGWIYRGFALQQMGQLEEARLNLLIGARKFPNDWRIAYNLACYSTQLGDMAGAWNWLERACQLSDAATIKSLAIKEPSLKPLLQPSGPTLQGGLKQPLQPQQSETETAAFAA